ncbi:MAG: hydrogenase maturation nickel metallochaperone HypA, partial [Lentisphaeria bacterium]|nr:hydrogenase maturation nickel metallochaperone HypA [Lentisphaeria bacterium]
MHELSIAEALVSSAAAWCRENHRKALALKIAVGRIGGVDPEALKIAWPMALDV